MTETTRSPVVCVEVSKAYADGAETIKAISDLSLEADAGKVTALCGPSGSGKTTLLHLIGGVEPADSGSVVVAGVDLTSLSNLEMTSFRALQVSFVFADLNLIPVLSILENVNLGLLLLKLPAPETHRRAMAALEHVGLADRAHRLPRTLSSGERQRVAIARALARRSPLVIADEPTAHLDRELADAMGVLLRDLATTAGSAVLMATHDTAVADKADRIIRLQDGRRTD